MLGWSAFPTPLPDAMWLNRQLPMLLRRTLVKKIPGEYLSGGCFSLSNLRGMTGLVTPGVGVGWSKAEPFRCAESVDSMREMSVTRGTDLVLWVGPS